LVESLSQFELLLLRGKQLLMERKLLALHFEYEFAIRVSNARDGLILQLAVERIHTLLQLIATAFEIEQAKGDILLWSGVRQGGEE
jgi:hypothetical protein